ncbi:hypothetical protein ACH5RR_017454 [Cinchona calisaya]|uniref:PUM-HD domain-containing protein n=1 Tax=Cinchona calisaya TaxID=153742 RepID=A0ABD2ZIL5_9GENT
MESSYSANSQTIPNGTYTIDKNNHPINANHDMLDICFGSLSLRSKNASTSASAAAAAAAVVSNSEKLLETQVMNEESKGSSSKIDNNSRAVQEFTNVKTEWPSSSSSIPHYNIWAGERSLQYGIGSSLTPMNYMDMKYTPDMDYAPDNDYRSLRDQTSFSYFHPNSSAYRSPNQFSGNSVLNYPYGFYNPETHVMNGTRNFRIQMENHFVNGQVQDERNSGCYYPMSNYQANSPYLQDQFFWDNSSQLESSLPGFDFFKMAVSPDGSEQLRSVLQQGNSWFIQETLRGVFPLIFRLMADINGHHVFEMLVDKCANCQLYAIMTKVQSKSDLFLDTAFTTYGSSSIKRLIKRLKRTGMEFTITKILSRKSYELMTDKMASHVITHCFENLGDKANQVLYDDILSYFLPLVTDIIGCITVNQCIGYITGPRRAVLLNLVANYAGHLAYDPSGNFVVQHVLGLNNDAITRSILYSLKGHYLELSLLKFGSHLVEKCLRSSLLGLSLVVEEMLINDKILSMLARDKFGNYVVQRTLEQTKLKAKDCYEALVEALKPHYSNLLRKAGGRYVACLIKDDIERQNAHPDQ